MKNEGKRLIALLLSLISLIFITNYSLYTQNIVIDIIFCINAFISTTICIDLMRMNYKKRVNKNG